MRWPGIERVWLPEWLDDPDATADRLIAAVEAAKAGVRSVSDAPVERVENLDALLRRLIITVLPSVRLLVVALKIGLVVNLHLNGRHDFSD